MKKLIISLGLLYVVVSATICYAATTGNELLDYCSIALAVMDQGKVLGDAEYVKGGSCLGMIEGIVNLGAVYQSILKRNALFCTPPNGIQNGQAIRIVVKYLKEHPEKLHKHALALVILAFKEAYPCYEQYAIN